MNGYTTADKARDEERARAWRAIVREEITSGKRKPCCGRGWTEACLCDDAECAWCGEPCPPDETHCDPDCANHDAFECSGDEY
jgi:hypothetical protein